MAGDGDASGAGQAGRPAVQSGIITALKAGDCDEAGRIAAEAQDVNARDDTGGTALMESLLAGCDKVSGTLVERGADVNAANCTGERPADAAASRGNAAMLKLLHDNGADMDFETSTGATVLFYATLSGDSETANLVLEYVREGFEKADAGPEELDRKVAEYVNKADNRKTTPLMNAAWAGSVETVNMLIALGADVYAEDYRGFSALAVAYHWEKDDIVKVLREAGPLFPE